MVTKLERFWDRIAEGYTEYDRQSISKNRDFIMTRNYLDINDTVMDYGCATSIMSNAIADRVKEIHAIDISPRMIEIAREKAAGYGIQNVHYATTSIFNDSFKSESFNVIIAFRVLHCVADVPSVIDRINELLKPGGVFISVTTCMGPLKYLAGPLAALLKKFGILPPLGWFSLNSLKKALTKGNFHIVEHEKMEDKFPTYCIVARKKD